MADKLAYEVTLSFSQIKEIILSRVVQGTPAFFGVLSASVGDFVDLTQVEVVDGEDLRHSPLKAEGLYKRVMGQGGKSLVVCYPSGTSTYPMTGEKYHRTFPLADHLASSRMIWLTARDRRNIEPGTLLTEQEDAAVDRMARAMDPEAWGEYDDGDGRCSNGAGHACNQSIRHAQRLLRSYPAILDIVNPLPW